MKSEYVQTVYSNEDDQKMARNLSIIVAASFFAYLVALLLNVTGDHADVKTSLVAFTGCILQAAPWYFLRRGHLHSSSMAVVLIGLGVITAFSAVGQGVRDVALLAFPIIFAFASLALNRAIFRSSVGLALAAVCWLALGEVRGWFVVQPWSDPTNLLHLAVVVILLVVAALANDLLAENMRESLRLAQQRNEAREKVESILRASEEKYRELVESIQDIVFSLDVNGKITFISPQISAFGHEAQKVISKHISEFMTALVHPEDLQRLQESLPHKLTGDVLPITFRVFAPDKQQKWMEISSKLQLDDGGNVIGIAGIMRDVTVRKEAERAAKITSDVQLALLHPATLEEIYMLASRKIQELIGDCITGVSLLDESNQVIRAMGYHGLDVSMEKIVAIFGRNLLDAAYPISSMSGNELRIYRSGRLERLEDGLHTILAALAPRPLCIAVEKLLRVKDIYAVGFVHHEEHLGAVVILARVEIEPYRSAIEQIVSLASFAINRQRAEDALQNNERRLQALIQNGLDFISLLDVNGNLLWESPSSTTLLGYQMNEFLGRNLFEIMHPDDRQWALPQFAEVAQTAGSRQSGVFRLGRADGSWRWVEAVASNFLHEPAVGAIVINYRDITERKQAEEAVRLNEARYRQAIMAAGAVPYYRDYQQETETYTFMGENILQLTGYSAAEITPAIFDSLELESTMRGTLMHLTQAEAIQLSNEGKINHWACDYRILTRDGDTRWIADSAVQIRGENDRRLGVIGILQDITERKLAEAKTLATLEEKETLLREVHHRVKNNLQAIIALIKIRASAVHDDETRQFLRELEGQARTMSLVYEQLYQAENLSQVGMDAYLGQLATSVLGAFGRRDAIQLSIAAPIALDIEKAMPCGLIVNELLTNVLKHAFPPDYQGMPTVKINMFLVDDTCNLTVSDNGVGLPRGYNWNSGVSLGLRLVNLWVTHQLGGAIQAAGETGTTFTITFDVKG